MRHLWLSLYPLISYTQTSRQKASLSLRRLILKTTKGFCKQGRELFFPEWINRRGSILLWKMPAHWVNKCQQQLFINCILLVVHTVHTVQSKGQQKNRINTTARFSAFKMFYLSSCGFLKQVTFSAHFIFQDAFYLIFLLYVFLDTLLFFYFLDCSKGRYFLHCCIPE